MGGLDALRTLLGGLPKAFALPMAIVQHRAASLHQMAVRLLQKDCRLTVVEVEDKEEIRARRVYLAPPDYHLLIERGSFALSTEEPVNHSRPSVDVLFESAADSYGRGVVGVILTGTGTDGAWGLARIKLFGGVTIVQNPGDAQSNGMPKAALAGSDVDHVLPLEQIGPFLTEMCFSPVE